MTKLPELDALLDAIADRIADRVIARLAARDDAARDDAARHDQWLKTREAAKLLGVSKQFLDLGRMRSARGGAVGLPFHKFGTVIRYSRAELDAWARQRTDVPSKRGPRR